MSVHLQLSSSELSGVPAPGTAAAALSLEEAFPELPPPPAPPPLPLRLPLLGTPPPPPPPPEVCVLGLGPRERRPLRTTSVVLRSASTILSRMSWARLFCFSSVLAWARGAVTNERSKDRALLHCCTGKTRGTEGAR